MNNCHLKYVEHVWKYYLNLVKEKLVGSVLEFTYLWDEALDRSLCTGVFHGETFTCLIIFVKIYCYFKLEIWFYRYITEVKANKIVLKIKTWNRSSSP